MHLRLGRTSLCKSFGDSIQGKTLQPRQISFDFDVKPDEFSADFLVVSFCLGILLLPCMVWGFLFTTLVKNEMYFSERPLMCSDGAL